MKMKYYFLFLVLIFSSCQIVSNQESDIEDELSEVILVNEEDIKNSESSPESFVLSLEERNKYNNGIYFDLNLYNDSKNAFFLIKDQNGETKKEFIRFNSGCVFRNIDEGSSIDFLTATNHIELFNCDESTKITVLGWFEYRIVIDGYVFYLDEAGLMRTNLDGSEPKLIGVVNNKHISYKDGYIYYESGKSGDMKSDLYRIKLDGSENQKISTVEFIDYCLTENGVIYLVEDGEEINIIFGDFDTEEVKNIGEFENEKYYIYRTIGMIDDRVYICSTYSQTIMDTGKLEIYEYKANGLNQIHISEDIVDITGYKPFIYGKYIYYKTADGLYQYNSIDNNNKLIAETMLAFSNIK